MGCIAVIGEGLVELELDQLGGYLRLAPGGDAANIAVMAARLDAHARIVGRVGTDPLGDWLVACWRDRGVDVAHVRSDPDAATGLYLNTPTAAGEHRFVYWRAASAGSRLQPSDLDDARFADLGLLVVTGVTLAVSRSSADAAQDAIERARAAGARIACVLNHRPALGGDTAVLGSVAGAADIVIGSSDDAKAVFGEADPVALARGPLPVDELVLTAADDPVIAVIEGTIIEQRVPPVPVVNAAGAGDAFAGAYLAQRLAGLPPAAALAWGVAASAQSVTRRGCASSYPTLAEAGVLADQLLAAA
jgi:2-dehydro-3-deoxygluconokinase